MDDARLPGRATKKGSANIEKKGYASLNWNDIEFYLDFVFGLNGAARDAYGTYAEVALLERCGTAIVARL
jgi:hypothetical protein